MKIMEKISLKIVIIGIVAILTVYLIGIWWRQLAPTQGTYQNPSLSINTWQTANKTKVYFNYSPEVPIIDVLVIFPAGPVYTPKLPGLAALTTDLLNEGTLKKSAQEVAYGFESHGANFFASTSHEAIIIGLRSIVDDKYLKPTLELFQEVISSPKFSDKDIARLKKETLQAIKLHEQNPAAILTKRFYKELYGDHPFAIPIIGTKESIPNITKDAISNFYKNYLVQDNAKIIIVGDISEAQAQKISNQLLRALPKEGKQSTIPPVNTTPIAKKVTVDFPSVQTNMALGTFGIKRDDPAFFPLAVGNTILGNMPLVSILFKEIREKQGLTYGISSSFTTYKNSGLFEISTKTRNVKATETEDAILAILQQYINDGPQEKQLTAAKQYLTGNFPLNFSSNHQKAALIADIAFYNLPLNYLDTYIKNVQKVSALDIKKHFRDKIDPNKLVIVSVGPNSTQNLSDTEKSN